MPFWILIPMSYLPISKCPACQILSCSTVCYSLTEITASRSIITAAALPARLLLQDYYSMQASDSQPKEEIMNLLHTVEDKDFLNLLITNIIFQSGHFDSDVSVVADAKFFQNIGAVRSTEEVLLAFQENFTRQKPPGEIVP
ncbi:hypothetical protein BEI61_01899 [Eisenbergiella tayi]|uniref:Uncharacterized protein n=2 Tax=Eisenbergiella tayi TaxID=1432052 RepID=A0A1E3AB54_9FIRM|nr:hypothetical protein BEI61_01899 [Eisenbergiella tayi]